MCWIQNSKPNPESKAATIKNNTNPSDPSGLRKYVSRVNSVISRKIVPKPLECVFAETYP